MATEPIIPPARLSGGELPAEERAEYLALRAKLNQEGDVHEVLALSKALEENRWLYLIKTPFASFPKYVIGLASPDLEQVHIMFTCGADWSAWAEWEKLNFGAH